MNLLFRADASTQIGTGHVMRCMALAQAWVKDEGQATFLINTDSPAIKSRLQAEEFEVESLCVSPGSLEDIQQTIEMARSLGSIWVVVDGYHFGAIYQHKLKKAGFKVLFLDDYGHAEHYYADLVLNQNIDAHESLYLHREDYTQLLLGTQYALLRNEFREWQGWERKISLVARKVLVTLGGSDPDNVTFKVTQALQGLDLQELEVIVVVGDSNPRYEILLELVRSSPLNVTLKQNATNMPELMAWADIAIAGGGSTCWELAFMGLPSLILILAENQQAIAKTLEKMQISICLGWHSNLSSKDITSRTHELLISESKQKEMFNLSKKLVDGGGASRTVKILLSNNLGSIFEISMS
jgi:UDP-2,4-diacetamido-2,4,6-trideoxy-beta-L-altropyranose hydrolase